MVINGSNRLACKVLLKSLGEHITVEPMRGFRVIKDLLVDMDAFGGQVPERQTLLHYSLTGT